MNDVMRKRIERKLANLPDEVVYQIMDYIEFLERKYGTGKAQPTPFQRIAEGVEDVLRAGRVPATALKGAMQVVDAAGRVVTGVGAAGKTVMEEIQKAADVSAGPRAQKGEAPAGEDGSVDGEGAEGSAEPDQTSSERGA